MGSGTRLKERDALVLSPGGLLLGALFLMAATPMQAAWRTFAGNSQHTAVSAVAAQPLEVIRWSIPVDLAPGAILIHYGSPLVTPANTVVVPVRTGSTGGYRVEARNAQDGSLIWSQTTDYILPPHNWTPSYSPTLTPGNRLYFPGAGGTVYFRDNVDSGIPVSTGQLAFFGMANYLANPAGFNSTVFINTPITSDSAGNIYFGFRTSGTAPLGLQSGIARIDANGAGSSVSAVTAAGGDTNITRVPHQAAPALSNDEQTLYVVVASDSTVTNSYVVGLDPTTLILKESSPGVKMRVALKDPRSGGVNNASVPDDSSASPMVGPDGDVYYGVLGNPFNGSRGWMLHFSGALTQTETPGAFGWDSTASIVAASLVPSYTGTSSYLIFAKYNNYAGADGGDGVNRIAVLDPNDTMVEPHPSSSGQLVMKEVLTIAGPTPDPALFPQFPNAVREWCINTAAVDPFTSSVMVNSEDGKLYRWDLTTNTLSQAVTLSPGVGEAYTPTLIGPDGTVYAINWAILNAVGRLSTSSPTPSSAPLPTNTPVPPTRTPTRTTTPLPTNTPAPTVRLNPIPSPIVVGALNTLGGVGFTAGSVVKVFVATAAGTVAQGPFTPTAQSPTTLQWQAPASMPLGRGFATVLVINTDQGFIQSNPQSQLLYGSAAANLPTIQSLNGVALTPINPKIPLTYVQTAVTQGTVLHIGGMGFNAPLVNLFTAAGNVGPLAPRPGGSATQIDVVVPATAPTGPGSVQVVNNPFTGNVLSNAVSVPIGEVLTISGVSQNGPTVTVTGTGFCSLSVINLFNNQASGTVNLGGLNSNGQAKIRLTVTSSNQFSFSVPPTAQGGTSYVQVLNPPFIPFTSTGGDPDGGFNLVVP